MTDHTDKHPPYPTLYHCPVGSEIQLTGETRTLTVEVIDGRYATLLGGMLTVDRCHRVNAACLHTGRQLMQFGNSTGWRPLSTRTVNDLVDNPRTDTATHCSVSDYDLLITE